jgi:malto-oligosyltrehalose synthase
MFNPVSTYRIQFHKGFSFRDFASIIPYLHQLGISTVYASPIFDAVPGSVHGYDCTNPLAINPEVGTLDELRKISWQLRELNIGWIQDIVPNHMAYHSKNTWLMDVLEKGEASEYASYFDIQWNNRGNEKLMAPFLSKTLEDAVNDGDLKMVNDNGKWMFDYNGSYFPILQKSIEIVLANDVHKNITAEKLQELAQVQHYRLCHWQETDYRINYRRFFTVNGLICLNIQDEKVFPHHHSFIKQLIDEGIFQGLRIDHIDGLYNPTEYLQRLRSLCGDDIYIVAEKILEPGETLPSYWPMEGSTGYDFLSVVNNLFATKKNKKEFTEFYQQLTENYTPILQQMHDKKAYILRQHMRGELNNLHELFLQLQLIDKKELSHIPLDDLKSAIGEFLVQCPVYRFYGTNFPLEKAEEAEVATILKAVRRDGESPAAVSVLEHVFLQAPYQHDKELNNRIAQFYQRCMQFAGPLMAKGIEDTLMYTNNRFAGHNEVGDSPGTFGIRITEFHRLMQERQGHWTLSMSTTSTHDTKRGEDVRARLNVLTDLSEQWISKVEEWMKMNAGLKKDNIPDGNDEYLIYQALIGHHPIIEEDDFETRIQQYLEKALREAKTHSNWTDPDEEYEAGTKEFVAQLLNKQTPFWKSFSEFLQQVHEHSMINSLSQVLLKFALPGVPDTYQGSELWDFSFVDPDNRRPVSYRLRQSILKSFEDAGEDLLPSLWKEASGTIKLWLIQKMLILRKADRNLFAEGDYIPLTVEGKYKEHVFAFARKFGNSIYLFALPLHTAALCNEQKNFFKIDWQDTCIVISKEFNGFNDILSRRSIPKKEELQIKKLFQKFTVAILKGK